MLLTSLIDSLTRIFDEERQRNEHEHARPALLPLGGKKCSVTLP